MKSKSKDRSNQPPDLLTQTFAALADPTRRALLARLSKGAANVSDLAKPFLHEMSLPAITKHLKVLEKAGLISKTREAQWRSCRINGDPLRLASDWMEPYRVFWEESFDRLGEYLKSITAAGNTETHASQGSSQTPIPSLAAAPGEGGEGPKNKTEELKTNKVSKPENQFKTTKTKGKKNANKK